MNTRIRNGIIISIFGIGLIIVGIFVLTRLVRQSLAPLPPPSAPTPIIERVVIASRDMAVGTVLQEGDITVMDVPVEVAPRNTFSDLEAALGKLTKVDLVVGEMVLEHHLADPTNINHDQAFVLGDNQVLIAFHPSDLMTDLGIIQRGDVVDVLVTLRTAAETAPQDEEQLVEAEATPVPEELFTFDAFQLVEVTAMVFDVIQEEDSSQAAITTEAIEPQPTQPVRSTDIRVRAYLLAMTPQDALLIKHLQDRGALFDLVLRNPTNTRLFGLTPVTEQFLIDKYELQVGP